MTTWMLLVWSFLPVSPMSLGGLQERKLRSPTLGLRFLIKQEALKRLMKDPTETRQAENLSDEFCNFSRKTSI